MTFNERNTNLEFYRVIVMLLIVAHHYVVNSGLMTIMEDNPFSVPSIYLEHGEKPVLIVLS